MMPSSNRMRILITGADGFVGKYLIEALTALQNPPEIIAGTYGSNTNLSLSANVRSVGLDVTDSAQTLAVIKAAQPTHLVHLAGIAAVAQASQLVRETWEVNANGTLNVALAIQRTAPECRLLFCSSAQVYGGSFRSGEPLPEDALLDPVNIYASSKAAADLLIGQMAKDGLRAVRLRPFNHTGPGQLPEFVIPAFASQIVAIERGRQEPVIKAGNLSIRRDFLDVLDVVDAYVKVILRFDSLSNGAVFNIASGSAISVGDILRSLLSLSPQEIQVIPDPERMRPNDTLVMAGDSQALRRALGWAPRRTIMQTLTSVLEYYRGI